MNSFEVREKRKHVLNEFQRSVIIGTILGDGHLLQTTRGYCLRLNHGIKQREYVDWKHSVLEDIAMPPKIYKNSYHFRTVSHPMMTKLRNQFYRGREKVVPDTLGILINPIALAVWIMDDGTNELGYSRCVRINTQCFSLEDHLKLIRILETNFGIGATLNRDKGKFRLRIRKESMALLRSLTGPYTIPSMFYKISP